MPFNVFRRHFRTRGKCLGGYEPDFRNYEHDELRRGWKRCHCPIYADGTLGRKFKRKAAANSWEAAGRWQEGLVTPAAPVQPIADSTAVASEGITIERAVAAFLAEHAESSAPNTQRTYGIGMRKLKAHSAEKGYVLIDQWEPMDVREFRQSWKVSPITRTRAHSAAHAPHCSHKSAGAANRLPCR